MTTNVLERMPSVATNASKDYVMDVGKQNSSPQKKKFDNLTEEWECTGDNVSLKKKIENKRVFEFLAGLNHELDDVRSRVLSHRSLPFIREVFFEVQQEESRRRVMLREHLSSGPEASALLTHGPHVGSSEPQSKSGLRQSKRTYCEHYGTLSPVASKGSIRISESITLNLVLHDLSLGKTIDTVKEREGLYYFDKTNVRG
ncbi:hypothetical protein CK203_067538 [Vitis vinifera]|uniref:Uncharacterized protein n=1 Tax=Vitis vinifera TaxID=29760 RepID=A0A438EBI5_VITVI|nr:hypothetical protein CK203_067538 [Vitis vinifera]